MSQVEPVYLYPEEKFIEAGRKVYYENMKADVANFEKILNENLSGKNVSISVKHSVACTNMDDMPESIFVDKVIVFEHHIIFRENEDGSKNCILKLPYYNIYCYCKNDTTFLQLANSTFSFKEIKPVELFKTSDKVALYDDEGCPTHIITKIADRNLELNFKLEEVNGYFESKDGKFTVPTDTSFISSGVIKWDSCSHWYFYGEDYKKGDPKSKEDSYYHLCGFHSYLNHIIGLLFAFKVASIYIEDFDENEMEYFKKYEYLLKDYTIKDYIEEKIKDK